MPGRLGGLLIPFLPQVALLRIRANLTSLTPHRSWLSSDPRIFPSGMPVPATLLWNSASSHRIFPFFYPLSHYLSSSLPPSSLYLPLPPSLPLSPPLPPSPLLFLLFCIILILSLPLSICVILILSLLFPFLSPPPTYLPRPSHSSSFFPFSLLPPAQTSLFISPSSHLCPPSPPFLPCRSVLPSPSSLFIPSPSLSPFSHLHLFFLFFFSSTFSLSHSTSFFSPLFFLTLSLSLSHYSSSIDSITFSSSFFFFSFSIFSSSYSSSSSLFFLFFSSSPEVNKWSGCDVPDTRLCSPSLISQ